MESDEKACEIYKQRCEGFRDLNQHMWRIPLIIVSITGGLWFAVANFELPLLAKQALLTFVGLLNLAFIFILYRLRNVMQKILNRILEYEGLKPEKGHRVVRWFATLMAITAIISFLGALFASDLTIQKDKKEIIHLYLHIS